MRGIVMMRMRGVVRDSREVDVWCFDNGFCGATACGKV